MRIGAAYLGYCDAVLRLPGASKGADLEVEEAKRFGMLIYYSVEGIPDNKE